MAKARVLVVDDDRKTAAALRLYLEHAGFEVSCAADGREALKQARATPPPDLVVLDLMLPQLDGFTVCRTLRAESGLPILMLTARSAEEDHVRGLELGADDYVLKPFSPRSLVARVRAILRRSSSAEDEARPIQAGPLRIDPLRREVRAGGREVALTRREFDLLLALARAPGRVFSRDELLERAFGPDSEALDRTVDAHIMNLRRKLEPDPAAPIYVQTVFGVGYRFVSHGAD